MEVYFLDSGDLRFWSKQAEIKLLLVIAQLKLGFLQTCLETLQPIDLFAVWKRQRERYEDRLLAQLALPGRSPVLRCSHHRPGRTGDRRLLGSREGLLQ